MKLVPLEPEEELDYAPCSPKCALLSIVFDGGLEDNPAILETYPKDIEWLDYEMEGGGLENLLGCDGKWYDWMLREGIAPGQEFTVRVPMPAYTTDYWGEHDVDYGDAEVIFKQPMSDLVSGCLWFAWFRDIDYAKLAIMEE
jgi:hypothetical protein